MPFDAAEMGGAGAGHVAGRLAAALVAVVARIGEAGADQAFWRGLHSLLPAWDDMITAFNRASGVA